MARPVDERIVKIRLENQDFKAKADETGSILVRLKDTLNKIPGVNIGKTAQDMAQIGKEADRVNMGRLASAVEQVSSRFSALGIIGITALQNITNEAINAGKGIISSLSGIEGMKSGFKEYELGMGSIQTILANTSRHGTTLEEVTASLDELNEYADKTIYNFGDMTRNVGLFTNAGLKVDESAKMIKGFSNEAAASGVSSEKAAGAAYQLSQALSAGVIRLMDWRSMTSAGMGNKNMQNGLMEIADAMGVLNKTGTKAKDIQDNFNYSLESNWLTADVMSKYLRIMAGDMDDAEMSSLGLKRTQIDMLKQQAKTAEEAATKVRTFTQLIGTLTEGIGSGWSQSWKLIIGDFEEATVFWTGINNKIGSIFSKSADARNAFLKAFKTGGGFKNLSTGFGNILKPLEKIFNAVGLAFRGAFPKKTTDQIVKLTATFAEMTGKLEISDETAEKIRSSFYNIFSTMKTGLGWVKKLGDEFVKLIPPDFGSRILNVFKWFTELTSSFATSLNLGSRIPQVFSGISSVFGWLGTKAKEVSGFLGEVVNHIKSLFTGVDTPGVESAFSVFDRIKVKLDEFRQTLGPTWQAVKDFFADVTAQDILSGGVLLVSFQFLKKIMEFLNVIKSPKDLGKALGPVLDTVSESVNKFTKNTPYDNLQKVAWSMLILAGSIKLLEGIEAVKIGQSMVILGTSLGGIVLAMAFLDKIEADAFVSGGLMKSIYAMAFSMLIISAALKNVSTVDPNRLWASVGAISVLFLVVTAGFAILAKVSATMPKATDTTLAFKKFAGSLIKTAIAISIFAIGFQIMANAIKALGVIDPAIWAQGLGTIMLLMLAVGAMQMLSGSGGSAIGAAIGVAILAYSLQLLIKPITEIGNIPAPTLDAGITAIRRLLLFLAGSIMLAKGGLTGAIGMAVAIKALEMAIPIIKGLGALSLKEVIVGIGTFILILGALAGAVSLAKGGFTGAISIAVVIVSLSLALAILARLPMLALFGSVLALAAALTVLGVAAYFLTPAMAIIYVLGQALFKMGLGLAFAAVSLAILGPALAVFAIAVAGSAVVIAAAIGSVLDAIIWLGPKIRDAFVVLIEMLCGAIVRSIPPIGDAVGMLVVGIIMVLIKYIDPIVNALTLAMVVFIEALNKALAEHGPRFIKAVLGFIGELLVLIAQGVAAVLEVVLGWIPGMNKRMEKNLKETTDIIRDAFDADVLALEVGEDLKKSMEGGGGGAFKEAGETAGEKTTGGFLESIGNFDFGKIGTGAAGVFGDSFGKFDFPGLGKDGMDNIMSGFGSGEEGIQKQLNSMMTNLGMSMDGKPLEDAGKKTIEKFAGGVKLAGPRAAFEAKQVADATAKELDLRAKARELAEQFINGYLIPFRTRKTEVARAAADLGAVSTRSLKNTLKEKSPSKITEQSGNYFVQGFINGIRDKLSGAREAAAEMANNATSAMNLFIDQFAGTFEEDNEYGVSLKPVLDLSGMGTLPNQTYGVTPDTSRTGNLFGQVAAGFSQNGNKNLQNTETKKSEQTVNVNVKVDGPAGFENDQRFVDKIKTVVLNEMVVGNRTVPNKTSLFPF